MLVRPYEELKMSEFEVIWKVFESSLRWDAYCAPRRDRVTVKNEEGCLQTSEVLTAKKKPISRTILLWCEMGSSQGFLHVIWLFVVGQAIIPHLKEERQNCLLISKSRQSSYWWIIIFWVLLGSVKSKRLHFMAIFLQLCIKNNEIFHQTIQNPWHFYIY